MITEHSQIEEAFYPAETLYSSYVIPILIAEKAGPLLNNASDMKIRTFIIVICNYMIAFLFLEDYRRGKQLMLQEIHRRVVISSCYR